MRQHTSAHVSMRQQTRHAALVEGALGGIEKLVGWWRGIKACQQFQ
jgi:hypothetical protein